MTPEIRDILVLMRGMIPHGMIPSLCGSMQDILRFVRKPREVDPVLLGVERPSFHALARVPEDEGFVFTGCDACFARVVEADAVDLGRGRRAGCCGHGRSAGVPVHSVFEDFMRAECSLRTMISDVYRGRTAAPD